MLFYPTTHYFWDFIPWIPCVLPNHHLPFARGYPDLSLSLSKFPPLTKPPPQNKAACATTNPNKLFSKTLIFGRMSFSILLCSSRLAQKAAVGFFNLWWSRCFLRSTSVAVSTLSVNYQEKSILIYINSCFFPLQSTPEDYSEVNSYKMIRLDRTKQFTKPLPYTAKVQLYFAVPLMII